LFDFSAEALPDERVIDYHSGAKDASLPDESLALWKAALRPMIVIGQMLPEDARRVEKYLSKLASHCVVLAEELSNLKEKYITCRYFDNVIANNGDNDSLLPDFIVTIGNHIVSKNLKQWLRRNSPQHHWSVSRTGEVADLFQCLTMVWECDAERAVEVLSQNIPAGIDADFLGEWDAQSKNLPMKPTDWEIAVLEQTLKSAPASWNIHVANSSMVRDIQRLPSTGCNVYCNRGINGIEGSVSAAVGLAAGSKKETLLLVGDLSFFYDRNGLWNNYVKGGELPDGGHLHLSVLLLNNGGGRIFRNIPGMERTPYRDTMVSGKHSTSAEGVAVESGCAYRSVDAGDISDEHIKWLMSEWEEEDKCVRILEIKKR
jgi:2-succinyl-5-enolpyruvyl-6-hydroxy-3-cyclohexene-1-carboxylate synthase